MFTSKVLTHSICHLPSITPLLFNSKCVTWERGGASKTHYLRAKFRVSTPMRQALRMLHVFMATETTFTSTSVHHGAIPMKLMVNTQHWQKRASSACVNTACSSQVRVLLTKSFDLRCLSFDLRCLPRRWLASSSSAPNLSSWQYTKFMRFGTTRVSWAVAVVDFMPRGPNPSNILQYSRCTTLHLRTLSG